jgi:hypothetical protein
VLQTGAPDIAPGSVQRAIDAGMVLVAAAPARVDDGGFVELSRMAARKCTVFVGCLPSGGGCYSVEDALGDVLPLAARDGTTTYPSYLAVPYGRGPLLVASEVQARVSRDALVLPSRLAIPRNHPCAPALIPVLAAAGCEIVWGVA